MGIRAFPSLQNLRFIVLKIGTLCPRDNCCVSFDFWKLYNLHGTNVGAMSASYRIYSVANVVFLTKNMTDIECWFPALLSEWLKGKLSGLVFFS